LLAIDKESDCYAVVLVNYSERLKVAQMVKAADVDLYDANR